MKNSNYVIKRMIDFILEEEKRIVYQKYSTSSSNKNTSIVDIFIKELEKVMNNED